MRVIYGGNLPSECCVSTLLPLLPSQSSLSLPRETPVSLKAATYLQLVLPSLAAQGQAGPNFSAFLEMRS